MQGIENEEKKKEPEKMGMPERLAFILVKPPLYSAFSLSQYKSKEDPGLDEKNKVAPCPGRAPANERMHVGFGACSMRGVCRLSRVAFSRC